MPNALPLIPYKNPPLELTIGKFPRPQWDSLLRKPASWDVATVMTRSLLDRVADHLQDCDQDTSEPMTELISGLWSIKAASNSQVWRDVIDRCISHPICRIIHQDPFALRSFQKPRGYSGDAVLIDYLYSRNCRVSENDKVTPLGEHIFEFIRDIPAGHGVRNRRDFVASAIDEVCLQVDRPRILSVACGHLREAAMSTAVFNGQFERFVALDQDEQSLRVVQQETSMLGITTIASSIKALFRGDLADERFDFVYTTGLYDYLDDRIAAKLTHRMFDMLNPGGRLLAANFLPDVVSSAYMEAFMDWKLIYRTSDEMSALCSLIPAAEIDTGKLVLEDSGSIVFLDVTKR